MIKLQLILAPTDFSAPSRHALKYAAEFARRFSAKLHIVSVVEIPLPMVPEMGVLAYDSQRSEEVRLAAQHALERLTADPMLKGIPTSIETLSGAADQEILRVAKERDADLLIVGTHGRTGLAHLFMGSVAEKLVRHASCPVLTVRPEGHQFVTKN